MSAAANIKSRSLAAISGLAALAAAILLARQSGETQALIEIGAHMTACLGGGAGSAVAGAPATLFGHCIACWGALATAIAGGGLIALSRRA